MIRIIVLLLPPEILSVEYKPEVNVGSNRKWKLDDQLNQLPVKPTGK